MLDDIIEDALHDIKQAGLCIREGGLVAFPTETVYGLGADAFNRHAVARVYSTKGRPGDNPLILHVDGQEAFTELAQSPPDYAMELIKYHWPGPLTLVTKKKPNLPHWLGGHPDRETDTIGIRVPSHPIAMALLKASGCVIAAPSANKAGRPSPTTAAHVLEDFPEAKDDSFMVLDGGGSTVGLESTVIDITGEYPVLLRPGAVTAERIRWVTGLKLEGAESAKSPGQISPRSPGMKYKHYAPRAPMTVVSGTPSNIASFVLRQCERPEYTNWPIGLLIRKETRAFIPENIRGGVKILISGSDDMVIAKNLFSCLRQFDKLGVSLIYAEAVPEDGLGMAIMDRMLKAAEGRVINV